MLDTFDMASMRRFTQSQSCTVTTHAAAALTLYNASWYSLVS